MSQLSHFQSQIFYVLTNEAWFVAQVRNWRRTPLPSLRPWGACNWKIALKDKVKQSKNGKFTSSYKASPLDFERKLPSIDKPLRI